MSLTLNELKDRLLHCYDAEDFLEMLNITAEDLLDRFEERLDRHWEALEEEMEDDEY